MEFIDQFKNQHKNITKKVSDVLACFDGHKLISHPDVVRPALLSLMQELISHLILEDKVLYPSILNSNDQKLIKETKASKQKFGNLKSEFESYIVNWLDVKKMSFEEKEFSQATLNILGKILSRNNFENKTLFPIILESEYF